MLLGMVVAVVMFPFSVFIIGCRAEVEVDLSVDRTNWLDPNDPLASPSFCSKSTLDQLALCKMSLEECLRDSKRDNAIEKHAKRSTDPTLKHIVRNMLHRMSVDIDKAKWVDRTVEVYLSTERLLFLKKYLNLEEETIAHREQVRQILEELIVPRDYKDPSSLKIALDFIISYLPMLNVVLLFPSVIILLRSHYSIRSFISFIFFVSFTMSLFTTYHKKYQENLAARMSRANWLAGESCKTKNFWFTTTEMLLSFIQVKGKSECLQFYEDIYISPVFEISPLDVIIDVLSNFIFTPLGIFGRHFNTFFNEFYRDSPLYLIPIKAVTFIFLIAALLFWLCGYRIRTLVGTLEPAGFTYAVPHTLQGSVRMLDEERPPLESSKQRFVLPSRHKTNQKPRNDFVFSDIRRRSLSAPRLKF